MPSPYSWTAENVVLKSIAAMESNQENATAGPRPEQSPFLSLLGTRVRRWEPGLVEIELDIRHELTNRAGIVHGGVIATLLDHGGGFSGTYCTVKFNARYAVTISMSCDFISQAKSGRLIAVGRKTGGGRKIYFSRVEIHDDLGNLIATGNGVYRYRRGSEVPEGVPR
jgi:uncharacterized protein (TIGR00369 family)